MWVEGACCWHRQKCKWFSTTFLLVPGASFYVENNFSWHFPYFRNISTCSSSYFPPSTRQKETSAKKRKSLLETPMRETVQEECVFTKKTDIENISKSVVCSECFSGVKINLNISHMDTCLNSVWRLWKYCRKWRPSEWSCWKVTYVWRDIQYCV